MYCRHCGTEIYDHQTVCLKCGKSLDTIKSNIQPQEAPKKVMRKSQGVNGHNKFCMAFLCFILGSLGIHNFVMGEAKKGIVKLLTSCVGLSYILSLIDLVRILTDTYTWSPDAFF